MSKNDRATAALESGQQYQMAGEWYTFLSFADRSLAHPQDWPNLDEFVGALWGAEQADDPLFLVCRQGGRVEEFGGWGTHYRAIDLIHETRHARGTYVNPWDWCDGFACDMVNL